MTARRCVSCGHLKADHPAKSGKCHGYRSRRSSVPHIRCKQFVGRTGEISHCAKCGEPWFLPGVRETQQARLMRFFGCEGRQRAKQRMGVRKTVAVALEMLALSYRLYSKEAPYLSHRAGGGRGAWVRAISASATLLRRLREAQ